MKKSLMLAVALLALPAGAAQAAKTTTISLDSFCDVLTITQNKLVKTAFVLKEDSTDCENLFGAGFSGRVRNLGHQLVIGLRGGTLADEEYVMAIDYPFVTGGRFIIYGTGDGSTLTGFSGSTYTVNGTPAHGAKPVAMAIPH
jgi:hypothetical protein